MSWIHKSIKNSKNIKDTFKLHHISFFIKDTRRARYTSETDEDALKAYRNVRKFENLNPSL